jgi:hypothetical protein
MILIAQFIPAIGGAALGFFTGTKYSCDSFACFFKTNRWGRLTYFGVIGFMIGRLFVENDPFGWF